MNVLKTLDIKYWSKLLKYSDQKDDHTPLFDFLWYIKRGYFLAEGATHASQLIFMSVNKDLSTLKATVTKGTEKKDEAIKDCEFVYR